MVPGEADEEEEEEEEEAEDEEEEEEEEEEVGKRPAPLSPLLGKPKRYRFRYSPRLSRGAF